MGFGPAPRAWAVFFFTWTSLGVAAANPAAGVVGCPSGWDQLLPPSQRARALEARGCSAGEQAPAVLAGQLSMYALPVTHGPLGPLAEPGGARAPEAAPPRPRISPRPARSTERPRGSGDSRPVALAPLIDHAARTHDIDPLLLHAIARVESRHKTGAISHAGAHGLMQVIVPTARRFGVNAAQQLHHPETNLDVSARYLKVLQRRFGNDLTLVLAAYNAGEGAVEKYGRRIPPYRETQGYVRKVMSEYELLRRVSLRQPAPLLSHAAAESAL